RRARRSLRGGAVLPPPRSLRPSLYKTKQTNPPPASTASAPAGPVRRGSRERGANPTATSPAISFKGAKQALTAFAPEREAARPEHRAALIDSRRTALAYHRVGNRPGRWEPRARKRRPKPGARLTQPRAVARLGQNRSKWY